MVFLREQKTFCTSYLDFTATLNYFKETEYQIYLTLTIPGGGGPPGPGRCCGGPGGGGPGGLGGPSTYINFYRTIISTDSTFITLKFI